MLNIKTTSSRFKFNYSGWRYKINKTITNLKKFNFQWYKKHYFDERFTDKKIWEDPFKQKIFDRSLFIDLVIQNLGTGKFHDKCRTLIHYLLYDVKKLNNFFFGELDLMKLRFNRRVDETYFYFITSNFFKLFMIKSNSLKAWHWVKALLRQLKQEIQSYSGLMILMLFFFKARPLIAYRGFRRHRKIFYRKWYMTMRWQVLFVFRWIKRSFSKTEPFTIQNLSKLILLTLEGKGNVIRSKMRLYSLGRKY